MSKSMQAYTPFHAPDTPSLAETLRVFEELADESASRKARVRGAVSTVARLLGKSATEIPALPRYLKGQFGRLKNRPTGLSAKSMANCKTELRYLLRKAGVQAGRSAFRALSPEWMALRDSFPDEPLLWKLSRFFAYCSAASVTPQQVDDAALEGFQIAMHSSAELDKPEQNVRTTIMTWNKLSELSPSADLPLLTVPPKHVKRWTIEPEKFLMSFQGDVGAWLAKLATVDPEAEEGPIRALRPASLASFKHQVFKAASALALSGRSIESVTSLASLVDMEAFKALMRHLRERQPDGKPTAALHGLAVTLKAVAKHHVGVSDEHVRRMARICANFKVEGKLSKSNVRLQAFEDERLLGTLLHLPDRLIEDAGRAKTSKRTATRLAQIAVAIEVELHAPFRIENLAALNLNDNIQVVTIKGQTRWIIRFDRDETKNHGLLTFEMSADAVRRIQRALAFYEQRDGWLFPGMKGSHKDKGFLSKQIKQEVERRISTPFNTHMMRGLVATMQIRENDNGFEMARAMLGDRSDRVIRQHYTSTAEQHLIGKAQDTLQRVRVRTAAAVPARSRRVTTN